MNDLWPTTWEMCGGIVQRERMNFFDSPGKFERRIDTFYPVYALLDQLHQMVMKYE